MAEAMSTIRSDFDRLALLSGEEWDHSSHYHNVLLRHVPSPCRESLEIGCGAGAFSRLLAKSSERVLALDLSPNMIRIAGERSARFPNIDFQVADVMTRELPAAQFDCIAAVATLHHLPMAEILPKLKNALKVGGVLLVLDLFQPEGLSDAATSALAMPLSIGLKLLRHGRVMTPRRIREAWAEHGRHDTYLTLAQVHKVCAEMLPGAEVKKHLLWRYSIIWKKVA
ncbi:MAG TPA: class I SAM-dependent methyltransferase [Pyrinomonadaceae bacterium]|jgi:ubiquinone/menaquinone biosynthesis C-methylase UbiE|nr:class I SAM-dependent methyltransferase [Pyrinomonadaceae bacterium]